MQPMGHPLGEMETPLPQFETHRVSGFDSVPPHSRWRRAENHVHPSHLERTETSPQTGLRITVKGHDGMLPRSGCTRFSSILGP